MSDNNYSFVNRFIMRYMPYNIILYIAFILTLNVVQAQQQTIILTYFSKVSAGNILCFDYTVNDQQRWQTIAEHYQVNIQYLKTINNSSSDIIQSVRIRIPVLFNKNLVLQKTNDDAFDYLPTYYLIKKQQKVLNLYLQFNSPHLKFIKTYNKLQNHYILNRDATIFIGFLRIKKRGEMQSYHHGDHTAYPNKESALTSFTFQDYNLYDNDYGLFVNETIDFKRSMSAKNINQLISITPNKQIIHHIEKRLNIDEEKSMANFNMFLKTEAKYLVKNTAMLATKNSQQNPSHHAEKSFDSTIANKILANNVPPSHKHDTIDWSKQPASFFRAEFDEEISNGKQEIKAALKAKLFKLFFDESDNKFYVLVNHSPPGATIKLINPQNGTIIFAKIISNVPRSLDNGKGDKIIVITEKAGKALGIHDDAELEVMTIQ